MSKYKLSSMQQKVFLETALYFKNNQDSLRYTFMVKEFFDKIGIRTNDQNELYTQVEQMLGMIIQIPQPKRKGYGKTPIFSYVGRGIDEFGRAFIEVAVDETLKPYFIEIANGDFFSYKIENTRMLKSAQSIKMYLYLKSWLRLGKHTISYAELKEILGVQQDDYSLFSGFKQRVLDKCQAEIQEKTDITFNYTLLRATGKQNSPVSKIKFEIGSTGKPTQLILPLMDDEVENACKSVKVDPNEVLHLLMKYGRDDLLECLIIAQQEQMKGTQIRSIVAYLHSALKNGSATGKAELRGEKKKQADVVRIDKEIKMALDRGLNDFKTRKNVELGISATHDQKVEFFNRILSEVARFPMLKDIYFDGDEKKVEVFQEGLGAELNKLSEDEIAIEYMQSIGKPIVKEKGFWKYA